MTEVALIVGGGPGIERELREAVHGARHSSRHRRSPLQHAALRQPRRPRGARETQERFARI
jgi:hypothetical protein